MSIQELQNLHAWRAHESLDQDRKQELMLVQRALVKSKTNVFMCCWSAIYFNCARSLTMVRVSWHHWTQSRKDTQTVGWLIAWLSTITGSRIRLGWELKATKSLLIPLHNFMYTTLAIHVLLQQLQDLGFIFLYRETGSEKSTKCPHWRENQCRIDLKACGFSTHLVFAELLKAKG